MNFVDELKWRGMIHDIMPGTEELLAKGQTTAYVGIDPTADSLHVGHLVSVMMMKHFPDVPGTNRLLLVGGATGMIGDPSVANHRKETYWTKRLSVTIMAGIKSSVIPVYRFQLHCFQCC